GTVSAILPGLSPGFRLEETATVKRPLSSNTFFIHGVVERQSWLFCPSMMMTRILSESAAAETAQASATIAHPRSFDMRLLSREDLCFLGSFGTGAFTSPARPTASIVANTCGIAIENAVFACPHGTVGFVEGEGSLQRRGSSL